MIPMSDDPIEQAIIAALSVLPLNIGGEVRRHVIAAGVVGAIKDAGLLPTEVEWGARITEVNEYGETDSWDSPHDVDRESAEYTVDTRNRWENATARLIYRYVGQWREVSGDEE